MMSLPWHETALQYVRQQLADDKLPHAIALSVQAGWGVRELLDGVVKLILGLSNDNPASRIAHPDLRWIEAEKSVIPVDEIRKVGDFAVQTAQISSRKVAAIMDAHQLNPSAANSLLKTLEEPPPNTHLVLATPYWGKLEPTIRSRCQRIMSQPDRGMALAWLNAQGIEVEETLFAEFGFAPLSMAGGGDPMALQTWLGGIGRRSVLDLTDEALGMDLNEWLARWYRRIILDLTIQADTARARRLLSFSDKLLSVRRQLDTSNSANPRALLPYLIGEWSKLNRTGRNT